MSTTTKEEYLVIDKTFVVLEGNGVGIPILSSYNKKGGNSAWRMLL